MLVVGHNIVGITGESATYKLVIVRVCFDEPKLKERFDAFNIGQYCQEVPGGFFSIEKNNLFLLFE